MANDITDARVVAKLEAWLTERHDRFLLQGGWAKINGNLVPIPNPSDHESANMWVTKANEVFAIRSEIGDRVREILLSEGGEG